MDKESLEVVFGEGAEFVLTIKCRSQDMAEYRLAASKAINEVRLRIQKENAAAVDYRNGPPRPCGCKD